MSNGVEWAIHSCSILGHLAEGQALPAAKLAEFHGVPAPYLTKHMQALVRTGICESVPGPHGGFRLSRPTDEITLLDITLAVDGEEHAFRCTEIRQRGPAAVPLECYTSTCAIATTMWRAEEAWRRELSEVSIADINAGLPVALHPDQLAAGAMWLVETLTGRS